MVRLIFTNMPTTRTNSSSDRSTKCHRSNIQTRIEISCLAFTSKEKCTCADTGIMKNYYPEIRREALAWTSYFMPVTPENHNRWVGLSAYPSNRHLRIRSSSSWTAQCKLSAIIYGSMSTYISHRQFNRQAVCSSRTVETRTQRVRTATSIHPQSAPGSKFSRCDTFEVVLLRNFLEQYYEVVEKVETGELSAYQCFVEFRARLALLYPDYQEPGSNCLDHNYDPSVDSECTHMISRIWHKLETVQCRSAGMQADKQWIEETKVALKRLAQYLHVECMKIMSTD